MSTSIEDMKGGMSSCCSALVYTDLGICSDCKEHCDIVSEDEEDVMEDSKVEILEEPDFTGPVLGDLDR